MNSSPAREAILNRLRQRTLSQRGAGRPGDAPGVADRTQALPLSWAQQRLWFLDQLDKAAGAAYHLPCALHLHGRLDCTALHEALQRR